MNNNLFNSIADLNEYRKSLELSSDSVFIDYLNDIYASLSLREETLNCPKKVIRRRSQEFSGNLLLSLKRNSSTNKKSLPKQKKDNGICLKTFLEYIDLQEFIGERFFKYLDKSKQLKLFKLDFVNGMNKIYYGDINELIKLTFSLCDFNEDGKIYQSDMKLLLAYIPSSSENLQKIKLKQINKIINVFFDNNGSKLEEGQDGEKEINFDDYSKNILNYEQNKNNINNPDLLNDYNNNGPFFYFISLITYLFQNCPFDVKTVDYFIYSRKSKKFKIVKKESSSSIVKKNTFTTAKKKIYLSNKMDRSSKDLTNIKLDNNNYQKLLIPKIGQKNLFSARSSSQKEIISERESEKYKGYLSYRKKENKENKDSIISKNKKEINMFKKTQEFNLFKDKLKKKQKNMSAIKEMSVNQARKEYSPLLSPFVKDFSQSPQLYLKKNNSNEGNSINNTQIYNKVENLKFNNSQKVKLPLIIKDKWSPVSVGDKNKDEDIVLKESEDFDLYECTGSEDESIKNIDSCGEVNDLSEVYLFKLCEDINGEQKILNKFYGVLSKKEILFFSSDLKNELCDLWYINKSYISLGKEIYNNQNYFTINIEFFNNNYVYKLFFLNETICQVFANKIKSTIHDCNFNDFYELQEKLGEGNFGTVNKCKNKSSGKIFAVKIINKGKLNSDDLELIRQEKNYLSLIKHPNIISLKDYYENKQNMYLITECCNGGDLFAYIEKKKKNNIRITEKEAARIVKRIAEGIKYLNYFGIVHRDIKPENILFSEEDEMKTLKIIDLGVCQTITYGNMANDPIGTNGYISPEIYLHEEYSFNTDIWSLGVILYLLITEGILPFDNENMDSKVIGKKVLFLQQEYPEAYFGDKSRGLLNLLDKMLEKNRSKRININDLVKNDWFKIIKT